MIVNHYKLVIPIIPDSINDVVYFGATFFDIRALKKKWQEIAMFALKDAVDNGDIPHQFEGKIGLFFRLKFETKKRRDEDNYYLMCKGIIDAFTRAGLIEDDDHTRVNFNGIRIVVDKDQPGVFIYITEKIPDDTKLVSIDYGTVGK